MITLKSVLKKKKSCKKESKVPDVQASWRACDSQGQENRFSAGVQGKEPRKYFPNKGDSVLWCQVGNKPLFSQNGGNLKSSDSEGDVSPHFLSLPHGSETQREEIPRPKVLFRSQSASLSVAVSWTFFLLSINEAAGKWHKLHNCLLHLKRFSCLSFKVA